MYPFDLVYAGDALSPVLKDKSATKSNTPYKKFIY